MSSEHSSVLAKRYAKNVLDLKGIAWIDEIGTWIKPCPGGYYKILSAKQIRDDLALHIDAAKDGFSDGKLKSTVNLLEVFQSEKKERLNETHIAFSDGLLDSITFDFEPFGEKFSRDKAYKKGDKVTFETFEYVATENPASGKPPSANQEQWERLSNLDRLAMTSLPISYEEAMNGNNSNCPKLMRYLRDMFVGNDGITPDEDLIRNVSLMMGYLLIPHMLGNKIFFLAGPKAHNGKSTFLKFIMELFPKNLVIMKNLKDFASNSGNNYGRAELPGKRIVICAEESSRNVDASALKVFSDGMTTIEARRIYSPPFDFWPTFKILAAFNMPPEFDNVDEGSIRRFMYIPCNRDFDKGGPTPQQIVKDLMTERCQILAFMVRQANELRKMNWRFPDEEGIIEEAKNNFLITQNSVMSFCKENYRPVKAPGRGIPIKDIYQHYVKYCEENNYMPFGIRKFGIIAGPKMLGDSYASNSVRCRRAERITNDSGSDALMI